MNVLFRAGGSDDAQACGLICYEAFKTIAGQHNFPHFAASYAGLAEAYSDMYEWYDGSSLWLGKAIEMNQKALTLDPTSLEAQFGIAMVYFHHQRFSESKRTIEGILKEDSKFYPAYLRLGMIAALSGDLSTGSIATGSPSQHTQPSGNEVSTGSAATGSCCLNHTSY